MYVDIIELVDKKLMELANIYLLKVLKVTLG